MSTSTFKSCFIASNFTDYTTLEEGSTVEVIDGIDQIGDTGLVGPVCGVIQWVGQIPDSGSDVSVFALCDSLKTQLTKCNCHSVLYYVDVINLKTI